MEKQSVFYAVSVGPGDPELLTRQACRVLRPATHTTVSETR